MVVTRAVWVKSCRAQWAGITAAKILCDRQRVVAIAAEYGVGLALVLVPDHRRVAGHFLVALDTGVKRVAALESDSDEVAECCGAALIFQHFYSIQVVFDMVIRVNDDPAGIPLTDGMDKTLRGGSSYNSSNDLRLHFGLGAETKIVTIDVRWPNGKSESFVPAGVDRILEIVEGQGKSLVQP